LLCFLPTNNHGGEILLGKMATCGTLSHRPKQKQTFQQDYVKLACFLNICKHVMVFLSFSTVKNLT